MTYEFPKVLCEDGILYCSACLVELDDPACHCFDEPEAEEVLNYED